MKPATPIVKLVIRVLNWFTVLIVVCLVGGAIYYLLKPVGAEGHNCTFDNLTCESNVNFVFGLALLFYAFIVGAVYGLIRVVISLVAKLLKKQ